MTEQDLVVAPDQSVASLRRVGAGQQSETLVDAHGSPLAFIIPVVTPGSSISREQFLERFRLWREGDPEEQRREWEQLAEVLAEERVSEVTRQRPISDWMPTSFSPRR